MDSIDDILNEDPEKFGKDTFADDDDYEEYDPDAVGFRDTSSENDRDDWDEDDDSEDDEDDLDEDDDEDDD
ncbi:MAG: hypothetical protein IJM57_01895, partial [Lachnospiraceae bacterium]|nr:hypothetical protein [Lachnospiraceae bacterium]